jgi:transcription initiation factor TFIIIB Brf1 subunit/transcription initiation factor TFIIB
MGTSLVLCTLSLDSQLVINMSHRRSLRFSQSTCPVCGGKEVARDDLKGDLLCTNCGHIVTRSESRSVGKFDIAQHLKRNGRMTFPRLKEVTGASDDKLFGVLANMESMDLISQIGGQYSLTKKGQRWYRQRLGQEWGY